MINMESILVTRRLNPNVTLRLWNTPLKSRNIFASPNIKARIAKGIIILMMASATFLNSFMP
jgi:hypothetical protein